MSILIKIQLLKAFCERSGISLQSMNVVVFEMD